MSQPAASPWKVPLFSPDFGPLEIEAVSRPVREQWLTMGPRVAELEERWRAHTGAKYAYAVSNATTGLHLTMLAAGIRPGDEVLVPTLTFVATANAVRYMGAKPVFVESKSEHDLNLDPEDAARRITPRTKAIIVVHYAGFAADLDPILALAKQHGLHVVEDTAHAVFSRVTTGGATRMCGSVGDTAAWSLFSNKNMTCGEGGLVTTNDETFAECMRLGRSHGMTSLTLDRHHGRAVSYDVVQLGYNFRLDEIHASLALAQLARLPEFLKARHRLFLEYRRRLAALPVTLPFANRPEFDEGATPSSAGLSAEASALPPTGIHILPVLLPEGTDRLGVMNHLKSRGVQSSIHYPPIHHFESFRADAGGTPPSLPRTEALAARQLTLPLYPTMTAADLELVVDALAGALTLD